MGTATHRTAPVEETLLDTTQAADLLGVRPMTLKRWRARREGPPHQRVGRKAVRYRRTELLAWLDRQSRSGQETVRADASRDSGGAVASTRNREARQEPVTAA